MKKCAKCGRDNLDDMLFCGYCSERFPAEKKPVFTANRTLLTFYLLPEGFSLPGAEKPKPASDEDFEIVEEDGETVLVKYKGKGGDVVIPDSVTSIGNYAFAWCESLTSITIPDSVTSIGYWAFENCTSLKSITIPDGVTSIGDFAFYDCTSLTSITIPDSVTSIGSRAFARCYSITSITIPDSVTSIGDWTFFGCKSLTSITIPDSVTSIGIGAFEGCESLTSITIPDSVTSIGYGAFDACKSLTAINADINNPNYCSIDGVLYDKNQTMLIACPGGKESVTIPNSVTSIGKFAFGGCKSLKSVSLPDSAVVDRTAFSDCPSDLVITRR